MSRGKYLSLEEARKLGKLDQFCKEHPSQANKGRFKKLLALVSEGKKEDDGGSERGQ